METLSFALVLIFVLWLIDKHNLWRRALKVFVWSVALGALSLGAFFGWTNYDAYETAKREDAESRQRQAADEAEHEAAVSAQNACMHRMQTASPKWTVFDQDQAADLCARNPDAKAVNLDVSPNPWVAADAKLDPASKRGSGVPIQKHPTPFGNALVGHEYGDDVLSIEPWISEQRADWIARGIYGECANAGAEGSRTYSDSIRVKVLGTETDYPSTFVVETEDGFRGCVDRVYIKIDPGLVLYKFKPDVLQP